MRRRGLFLLGTIGVVSLATLASGGKAAQDTVRRFRENGIEYVEMQHTVRKPVTNTRVEERQETYYQEQYVTHMHEQQYVYYTPVTEYVWEQRVHNPLNLFNQRYVAYHLVPRTKWKAQTHTLRTPVTQRQMVAQTRTVQVPVRELGFTEQQQTQRMAVNVAPQGLPANAAAPALAMNTGARVYTNPNVGGVLQMDGDHPRYGWRADGTRRY